MGTSKADVKGALRSFAVEILADELYVTFGLPPAHGSFHTREQRRADLSIRRARTTLGVAPVVLIANRRCPTSPHSWPYCIPTLLPTHSNIPWFRSDVAYVTAVKQPVVAVGGANYGHGEAEEGKGKHP